MSKLLGEFLKAWLEWAEGDAPDGEPFLRLAGLCSNFRWDMQGKAIPESVRDRELILLDQAFEANGLAKEYPFGGCRLYSDEAYDETIHLNPDRLAWVRGKVAQYEDAKFIPCA